MCDVPWLQGAVVHWPASRSLWVRWAACDLSFGQPCCGCRMGMGLVAFSCLVQGWALCGLVTARLVGVSQVLAGARCLVTCRSMSRGCTTYVMCSRDTRLVNRLSCEV